MHFRNSGILPAFLLLLGITLPPRTTSTGLCECLQQLLASPKVVCSPARVSVAPGRAGSFSATLFGGDGKETPSQRWDLYPPYFLKDSAANPASGSAKTTISYTAIDLEELDEELMIGKNGSFFDVFAVVAENGQVGKGCAYTTLDLPVPRTDQITFSLSATAVSTTIRLSLVGGTSISNWDLAVRASCFANPDPFTKRRRIPGEANLEVSTTKISDRVWEVTLKQSRTRTKEEAYTIGWDFSFEAIGNSRTKIRHSFPVQAPYAYPYKLT